MNKKDKRNPNLIDEKKSSILRLQVLKLLRTILLKVLNNSKKNKIAEEN